MSHPVIIGIAGKARVGKDTVADILISEIGGYTYSMATPIKAMIHAGFDIDPNAPYWKQHKEDIIGPLGVSLRDIMQTLGTEWGREMVGDDVWLVMAQVRLMKHGAGMIIPDVRFDNEAEWIRNRGGVVIHVNKKETEQVKEHRSEAGVKHKPGEIVLDNDGTIEDLKVLVRGIIDGWNEA